MKFQVLYEDNHLLAVIKPAGLPTMGVAAGIPSLLSEAKQYIKNKYDKPGNVYLGIVSRLDAPVTGVLLLARTSKAAARLTKQYREGDVEKNYWAIVSGRPTPSENTLTDWVRKDERHRRMHLCSQDALDAKWASLSYRTQKQIGKNTLLEVQLQTGRKHQIRLQLSGRDWPILGDRKYRSQVSFPEGIALHARYLALDHPVKKTPLEFTAPVPKYWPE